MPAALVRRSGVTTVALLGGLLFGGCAGEDEEGAAAHLCSRLCNAKRTCYEMGYPDSELGQPFEACRSECLPNAEKAPPEEIAEIARCLDKANSCKDYDDVCDIF
jgi:hypothetical protein